MNVDPRLRNGTRLWGNAGVVVAAREGHLVDVDIRELVPGDWVGMTYGEGFPTDDAALDWLEFSPLYGSQKHIRIPAAMSEELALLLGMYVSEGHTTASTHTVGITNAVPRVLEMAGELLERLFGLTSRVSDSGGTRCPTLVTSSKTLVECLGQLGCGARAKEKRIPRAVMDSSEPVVLAILQGLFLDAYTSINAGTGKWAICLDSPKLLDQLQTLLRWLGIVSGRISKYNPKYAKCYDEVFVCGTDAQRLLGKVSFLEPDKQDRARMLKDLNIKTRRNGSDVVPLVHGSVLYADIPRGASGTLWSWVRHLLAMATPGGSAHGLAIPSHCRRT